MEKANQLLLYITLLISLIALSLSIATLVKKEGYENSKLGTSNCAMPGDSCGQAKKKCSSTDDCMSGICNWSPGSSSSTGLCGPMLCCDGQSCKKEKCPLREPVLANKEAWYITSTGGDKRCRALTADPKVQFQCLGCHGDCVQPGTNPYVPFNKTQGQWIFVLAHKDFDSGDHIAGGDEIGLVSKDKYDGPPSSTSGAYLKCQGKTSTFCELGNWDTAGGPIPWEEFTVKDVQDENGNKGWNLYDGYSFRLEHTVDSGYYLGFSPYATNAQTSAPSAGGSIGLLKDNDGTSDAIRWTVRKNLPVLDPSTWRQSGPLCKSCNNPDNK